MKTTKYFKALVRSVDTENHTAEVVVSDETVDRYHEIINVNAYKKTIPEFMKHPVLLSSHAYHGLLNQIGVWDDVRIDKKNKQIVATPRYFVGEGNPEADWAWKLVEKGVAAFSVGFIVKSYVEYEDDDERMAHGGARREFTDIELLEISQVLVPANPSALQRSFKDEDDPLLREYLEEACKILGVDVEKLEKETPINDSDTVDWEGVSQPTGIITLTKNIDVIVAEDVDFEEEVDKSIEQNKEEEKDVKNQVKEVLTSEDIKIILTEVIKSVLIEVATKVFKEQVEKFVDELNLIPAEEGQTKLTDDVMEFAEGSIKDIFDSITNEDDAINNFLKGSIDEIRQKFSV